jgi:hypothetical protein
MRKCYATVWSHHSHGQWWADLERGEGGRVREGERETERERQRLIWPLSAQTQREVIEEALAEHTVWICSPGYPFEIFCERSVSEDSAESDPSDQKISFLLTVRRDNREVERARWDEPLVSNGEVVEGDGRFLGRKKVTAVGRVFQIRDIFPNLRTDGDEERGEGVLSTSDLVLLQVIDDDLICFIRLTKVNRRKESRERERDRDRVRGRERVKRERDRDRETERDRDRRRSWLTWWCLTSWRQR